MSNSQDLIAAFFLGVVCGLRSMTGPAGVAWGIHRGAIAAHGAAFRWWGSTIGVALLTLAAIAELFVDKLPATPSRLQVQSLVVRAVVGGFCGTAIALGASGSLVLAFILGAIGGLAGSFAGYYARMGIEKALGLPDWTVAVAEDVVAIAAVWLIAVR